MTKQRINEIKRKTVYKAAMEFEKIDFQDSANAALKAGMILGELSKDLERELYKEMNVRNRINRRIYSNPKRGDKNEQEPR